MKYIVQWFLFLALFPLSAVAEQRQGIDKETREKVLQILQETVGDLDEELAEAKAIRDTKGRAHRLWEQNQKGLRFPCDLNKAANGTRIDFTLFSSVVSQFASDSFL